MQEPEDPLGAARSGMLRVQSRPVRIVGARFAREAVVDAHARE